MAQVVAGVESIARRAVAILRSRIPVTQAYLFGSYVEGIPDEDSDIDIAVFSSAADAMSFDKKVALIIEIERQIDAPVELHLFGEQSLAEARPTNFFGYICSHGKPIV